MYLYLSAIGRVDERIDVGYLRSGWRRRRGFR